ncbi:ATP-binding cassette domain-containing protein, partial [Bifidobacterium mongoliense]
MSEHDTILTMDHITKTFGPVKALTDVNLSVQRGEIHAICGENGAGKSTL